jgi:hypothetical protein
MKTTKLLTAVSAAALLGMSSFAIAQGTGGAAGSSSGNTGAPSTGMQSPSGSGGSMSGDRAQSKDSKDGMKSQAQGKEMERDGTKSDRAQQNMGKDTMGKDTQKSQAQQGKDTMGKDAQKSQAQTPSTDSKSQMSQDKDGAKSGSTVGAATSGSVNLTSEQRTTIRNEVLTSNAPRATNINFSVNVGTVVPSTVRVVEVPATIVKIHPRWKGFRYFVYNDEIIIVEPRTLKIVAVLDV